MRRGELKSEGYQGLLEKMTGKSSVVADPEGGLRKSLEDLRKRGKDDPWGSQLDWTPVGKLARALESNQLISRNDSITRC